MAQPELSEKIWDVLPCRHDSIAVDLWPWLSRYLATMSKTEQFVASAGAMLLNAVSTNVHLVSPKCDGSEPFASVTLITVYSSPKS
jgi:hypothetical protein